MPSLPLSIKRALIQRSGLRLNQRLDCAVRGEAERLRECLVDIPSYVSSPRLYIYGLHSVFALP
jgi:hypothetical protein